MGLFWRRKSKDEFVTLGLNEPAARPGEDGQKPSVAESGSLKPQLETAAKTVDTTSSAGSGLAPELPVRQQPTVPPLETHQRPARTPFATSVLGLNLTIEELQAQEAALEQEFSARFRRAVAATRESLSEKLDTVFQGRKQIDEALLEELEEALIATDIGVPTTTRNSGKCETRHCAPANQ